ncbi:protein ABHD12B [Bombina bombina]|uniref:protein ABHD12B n=1 Tax=Bombina bombina TaxID=8345 RepID=UPI00235A7D77|nr:protein ABHD12B [Bombina bombina]
MKRREHAQKGVSGSLLQSTQADSKGVTSPPGRTTKRKKKFSSRLVSFLKLFALALLIIYISIPFIIRLFPVLLAKVVFLNIIRAPYFVDFTQPEVYLNHTTNFYLTTEEGVTVGVWHTVPVSRGDEARGKDQHWYETALSDNNPVIIYLHGNGGTRAIDHRVQLVKILSAAGFHVLSIDYRGFADSTGEPSEEGVTTDSVYIYEWVKARTRGSPVCLWGHSLGTGVATNAARKLQEKGNSADGVILEAPYTNIREEGEHHPFGKIYHLFPGFGYFFLDTFGLNNIFFRNDENAKILSSPILILHAEDDNVVPSTMARKLHQIGVNHNLKDKVKLVLFPAEHGYRHQYIYKDPKLGEIVWTFLNAL